MWLTRISQKDIAGGRGSVGVRVGVQLRGFLSVFERLTSCERWPSESDQLFAPSESKQGYP